MGIRTDSSLLPLVAAYRQGDEESACELRAVFVAVLVKSASFTLVSAKTAFLELRTNKTVTELDAS